MPTSPPPFRSAPALSIVSRVVLSNVASTCVPPVAPLPMALTCSWVAMLFSSTRKSSVNAVATLTVQVTSLTPVANAASGQSIRYFPGESVASTSITVLSECAPPMPFPFSVASTLEAAVAPLRVNCKSKFAGVRPVARVPSAARRMTK